MKTPAKQIIGRAADDRGHVMPHIRQKGIEEILGKLPDVASMDVQGDIVEHHCDLFLCALGFEDRCLEISEKIAAGGSPFAAVGVYFEYATNVNDNRRNRGRLLEALNAFAAKCEGMPCDGDDFSMRLRAVLAGLRGKGNVSQVVFDISVCSSKLLMLALKVLFEFEIELRLVYSEAAIYHPTKEEYRENPDKWTTEEGFGLAKGVARIIPSAEHPGNRRDLLPETIVVFPTFKPERTRAVITYVDESLRSRPGESVVWMVGEPHLPEDSWRANIMVEINRILETVPVHKVSTFDYKATLATLERIWETCECSSHITISPLGSKLQSVGIALFWYMRQDVSIVFAMPQAYNAAQYSEGCKATWSVDFGNLADVRKLLDSVGQLELAP